MTIHHFPQIIYRRRLISYMVGSRVFSRFPNSMAASVIKHSHWSYVAPNLAIKYQLYVSHCIPLSIPMVSDEFTHFLTFFFSLFVSSCENARSGNGKVWKATKVATRRDVPSSHHPRREREMEIVEISDDLWAQNHWGFAQFIGSSFFELNSWRISGAILVGWFARWQKWQLSSQLVVMETWSNMGLVLQRSW